MLWKKTLNYAPFFKFVAVLEAEEVNADKQVHGLREFSLTLADGSTVKHSFESDQYQKWWSSFLEGGQVINP